MLLHMGLAVLTLGVAACAAAQAEDKGAIELPARGLCAHRGAMNTHPENTLAAFREAVRLGAHMIELDVYLTKDRKLVVIHDATVDRTTDGTGKVSELTLAEIRRLDAGAWKGPLFEGERVPTLREALDVMPVNVWLNVHLKGGAELGRAVAEAIMETDRRRQAFLACGKAAAEAARAAAPNILICNMERQGGSRDYVDLTIELGADFIQLTGDIGAELPAFTQKLKGHGIRINYFGTDSPEELRRLFAGGVEFPLVNQVELLMPVAAQLGMPPVTPVFR